MPTDATTFFLSFLAVFAGIALYAWHLERVGNRLAQRVAVLESLTAKPKPHDSPAPHKE